MASRVDAIRNAFGESSHQEESAATARGSRRWSWSGGRRWSTRSLGANVGHARRVRSWHFRSRSNPTMAASALTIRPRWPLGVDIHREHVTSRLLRGAAHCEALGFQRDEQWPTCHWRPGLRASAIPAPFAADPAPVEATCDRWGGGWLLPTFTGLRALRVRIRRRESSNGTVVVRSGVAAARWTGRGGLDESNRHSRGARKDRGAGA